MASLCVYLGHMAGPRASTGPRVGLMVLFLFNFIFCVLSVCVVFVYCPLVLSGSLEESPTFPTFSQVLPSVTSHPSGPGRVGLGQVGTWSGLVPPSDLLLRPPVLPSSLFKTKYPCL